MIEFNEKDFNIPEILKASKLSTLKTKQKYRAFGLKRRNNPLICIRFGDDNRNTQMFFRLDRFFHNNGMQIECENTGSKNISIGLRKDLRNHVVLSSCVLSTIIYALEGRLKLNTTYPLAGIPKFRLTNGE